MATRASPLTAGRSDPMLLRLLQLSSATLPVGAYAYSQGLEPAVDAGWVNDESTLVSWLGDQLGYSFGRIDLPILARLHAALRDADEIVINEWRERLIACRETRELLADDCDRGRALTGLLRDLGITAAVPWASRFDVPFALAWAIAAVAWEVPLPLAAQAHAWVWLESQALAGVKLVPLGQVAGQRVLLELASRIPALCERALRCPDDEIGGTLPIVALASSRHETQYTRLFRS